MGLVAPWHVGSSQTRDQSHVSCIGRQILYHGPTWEAPSFSSFCSFSFFLPPGMLPNSETVRVHPPRIRCLWVWFRIFSDLLFFALALWSWWAPPKYFVNIKDDRFLIDFIVFHCAWWTCCGHHPYLPCSSFVKKSLHTRKLSYICHMWKAFPDPLMSLCPALCRSCALQMTSFIS